MPQPHSRCSQWAHLPSALILSSETWPAWPSLQPTVMGLARLDPQPPRMPLKSSKNMQTCMSKWLTVVTTLLPALAPFKPTSPLALSNRIATLGLPEASLLEGIPLEGILLLHRLQFLLLRRLVVSPVPAVPAAEKVVVHIFQPVPTTLHQPMDFPLKLLLRSLL